MQLKQIHNGNQKTYQMFKLRYFSISWKKNLEFDGSNTSQQKAGKVTDAKK